MLNVLFMSLSNLGAINMNAVVVVAAQERAVLYRERASGMYAASAYVHAGALVRRAWSTHAARQELALQGRSVILLELARGGMQVELPYLAAQVIIFCPVAYFMVHFTVRACCACCCSERSIRLGPEGVQPR